MVFKNKYKPHLRKPLRYFRV